MADTKLNLDVRLVPLPRFKPYAIVNVDTNEIVAWYDHEPEARADLKRYQSGVIKLKASQIQKVNNVIEAAVQRMEHPFGEPGAKPLSQVNRGGRRSVEL